MALFHSISLCFPLFLGGDVEAHKYNSGSSTYKLNSAYPKTISAEINQATVPPFVNAAHHWSNTAYLIAADTVFEYTTSGSAPTLTYTFVTTYQFNENSAANPFSAGPSSDLATPPSTLSALYGKSSLLLAFSGRDMYQYEISSQKWSYLGVASTPCSHP